jgi:NAD(P)-dependent dehydrogenase (short-subunit alcohol dehydrogenase family)
MNMNKTLSDIFDLSGRVAVITGGAGLLGVKHAEAIAIAGGIPLLVDIRGEDAERRAAELQEQFGIAAFGTCADITRPDDVHALRDRLLARFGRIDILINNAAINPKQEDVQGKEWSRLENFPFGQWEAELAVGLTGAFLCSQILGSVMAERGHGVILNVSSDLGVIAPDQRIYRRQGLPADQQPVKPVTYSVIKTGLLGLTRYLATYWAEQGVRVNSISPGGVSNEQPEEFVRRLTNLIPLGRMAKADEYQGAIIFLCSDASAYMTGANLVIDGGRTSW